MGNTLDKPKTEKDTSVGGNLQDGLTWGVSSMQGWRLSMEDAHIISGADRVGSDNGGGDNIGVETTIGDEKNTRGGEVCSKDTNEEEDQTSDQPNRESGDEAIDTKDPKNELLKLPPHHYFFCVLDGHGGDFAAHFSRDHLLPILLEQDDFQEYERIWRETTTLSLEECNDDTNNNYNTSPSKLSNKKRKKAWHSKDDIQEGDSQSNKEKWNKKRNHSKNKISKKKNNRNNRHEKRHDRNLEQLSQLLQRALEDAFVELDVLLLQEMVRQNMVIPPNDGNTGNNNSNSNNNISNDDDDDNWGTYDDLMEEDASNNHNNNKSQNQKGETISGTTAVAVLLTPDWIFCANLGDSRASFLLSSSSIKQDNAQHHSPPQQQHQHQHASGKTKKKRKDNKKNNSANHNSSHDYGNSSKQEEEEEEDYWTIVALSEDHKPDLPEEHARIEAANGSVTMGGRIDGELAVSRAFGDFGFKDAYPRHLYECDSMTKRRSQRRQRRIIQANVLEGDKMNGLNEELDEEVEEDLDWEQQRTLAQQLKVSPFPEVFAYPRGQLKEEGTASDKGADGPNGKEKILLLACDGIWDVMTNENCHNLVQELLAEGETNMGLVAEEILDTCLKKGSRDNMTMMVVHFSDAMTGVADGSGGNGGGVLKRRKQRNFVDSSKR